MDQRALPCHIFPLPTGVWPHLMLIGSPAELCTLLLAGAGCIQGHNCLQAPDVLRVRPIRLSPPVFKHPTPTTHGYPSMFGWPFYQSLEFGMLHMRHSKLLLLGHLCFLPPLEPPRIAGLAWHASSLGPQTDLHCSVYPSQMEACR